MPSQDKKDEIITQSLCLSTVCTIIIIATIALQWIMSEFAFQWDVFSAIVWANLWANIAFVTIGYFILNGINDKFKVIDKFRKLIRHTN